MVTSSVEVPAANINLKKRRRRKMKSNNGLIVQSMDKKDKHMDDFESGKNGVIAEDCSQDSLMQVDSAIKLSLEHPKADTVSTEAKKYKHMDAIESGKNGAVAEGCSQDSLIQVDSAIKLSQEHPNADSVSTTNPLENSAKPKKKRRKRAKKKAGFESGKNGGIAENCSQDCLMQVDSAIKLSKEHRKADTVSTEDKKDKHMDDIESGKNGAETEGLMQVDSAVKLSQEHPNADPVSTTNPLENSAKPKKKRRKRAKKKADFESGKNGVIAEDCSQDSLMQVDSAIKLSQEHPKEDTVSTEYKKDKHMDDIESGKNGAEVEDCSQDSLMQVDLAIKLTQEHPNADPVSMTNPLENSAKPKKKRRKRPKKKAENKHGPQNLDHTDIISSLSLAYASDGHPDGEINNTAVASQEAGHSAGKGSTVSLFSPSADLAQNYGESLDLCRNHYAATSPTKFSLADASNGHSDGKINNIGGAVSLSSTSADLAQKDCQLPERVELDLEIQNTEVKAHRSPEVMNTTTTKPEVMNEVMNTTTTTTTATTITTTKPEVMHEAQNFLLAERYQIPKRRPFTSPRRKLLILDVNGLLADIVSPPPLDRKANTNISGRAIFKRPFYYDFLKFCFERFDVGIWSSRSKRIIDRVVDYLLGNLKHKLLFCWDMFHCTQTSFRTLENRYKPLVLKELRKLWEKHDPNLPWEKGDYDESNTLLVDDSPYKALLNPMHTGVFPYSYRYINTSDNSLGPEGDLRVYLEGLATTENVQSYVERYPFGQGDIIGTHLQWNFYSKVLQSFRLQSDKEQPH